MNTRFKMIAAALGLVIATGAIGDVSAKTVSKTVATRTAVTKTATTHAVAAKSVKPTVKIAGRAHRIHLVRHGATRWSVAHRLTPRVTVAHKLWLKPATKVTVVKHRLVGVQKTAMAHRTIVKKTIIR